MSALTTPAYHLAGARQRSMAGAGPKPAGQALEWRLDLSETDQYGLCAKPLPQMPYTHSFAQAGAYPDLPDALLSQRTGMPFAKTENRERKNRRNRDFRADAAFRTKPGTCASTGVSGRREKGQSNVWPSISGGEDEDRTHDLRIANAALSQLSYPPTRGAKYSKKAFQSIGERLCR